MSLIHQVFIDFHHEHSHPQFFMNDIETFF